MAKDTAAPDYTEYVGKDATEMQTRMIEWLQSDEVGADASAAKNKQEAFELGVRLGIALRIPFQKSDFNQAARTEAAEAREAKLTEKATSKKATKKAKEVVAEVEEDDEEETEEEAPKPAKKAGKKAATKKAPAKKAGGKKAAAPAADEDDEDDEF